MQIEEVHGGDGDAPTSMFKALGVLPGFTTVKDLKQKAVQWDIEKGRKIFKYRYEEPWNGDKPEYFFKTLINSEAFQNTFKVRTSASGEANLGVVDDIKVKQVPATLTSLSVFDCLKDGNVATDSGNIKKCIPDELQGVAIEDEYRKVLLDEDSEHYHLLDDSVREEFLFELLVHISVGGGLCQYEDNINIYIDTAKKMYKDLLSVQKNKNTGKVEIASTVYSLQDITGGESALFPNPNPFNSLFLCVDTYQRTVWVYYFSRESAW